MRAPDAPIELLVKRVVYVACDPVSLARDARELIEKGYRPLALQLFDLFPQTRHLECVLSLARTEKNSDCGLNSPA